MIGTSAMTVINERSANCSELTTNEMVFGICISIIATIVIYYIVNHWFKMNEYRQYMLRSKYFAIKRSLIATKKRAAMIAAEHGMNSVEYASLKNTVLDLEERLKEIDRKIPMTT